MKILIIEDNLLKLENLTLFIDDSFPKSETLVARSYQSGFKALDNGPFDFVLLDMTMPTFDETDKDRGGRRRPYAGRDLLSKMYRRNLRYPVVVVTRYDVFGYEGRKTTLVELHEELKQEFPGLYFGYNFYDPSKSDWTTKLKNLIMDILKR